MRHLGATCRGCYTLGSACGTCDRCISAVSAHWPMSRVNVLDSYLEAVALRLAESRVLQPLSPDRIEVVLDRLEGKS